MKKILLLVLTLALIVCVLFFVINERTQDLFRGLNLIIIILILAGLCIFIISQLKRSRELKEGQPLEDEMSERMKFKAGYYAYMSSMYMWLFLFLIKEYFPNIESLLGGGILISALIFAIAKILVKKRYHA